MVDLASYCNAERDSEQVLIAQKKRAQVLKYGRQGKATFYPFRLSNDETSLTWVSSGGYRRLKLASISRIILGQRTDNKDLTSTGPSNSTASVGGTREGSSIYEERDGRG